MPSLAGRRGLAIFGGRGAGARFGAVLYSRPRKFLGERVALDAERLRALWPTLHVGAVERQFGVICSIAEGDPACGAIAGLLDAERFGWMTAPANTVVQPGLLQAGVCHEPAAALDELFAELIAVPPAERC